MRTVPNDTLTGDTKNEWKNGHSITSNNAPLTKREYFSVMAMQGLLSGLTLENIDLKFHSEIIKDSVRYADALIEELNKEDEE